MKEKSKGFEQLVLQICKVSKVSLIKRSMINQRIVELMVDFLPVETTEILIDLFGLADKKLEAIHLSAESSKYSSGGFGEMTQHSRTLICRIIGSQGREIEITKNGIIVSPHSALTSHKKKQQELQIA